MIEDKNQVSWNIAATQANQLAYKVHSAFDKLEGGDFLGAYYSFRRIRNQFINHEIDPTKRKLLDQIQNLIADYAHLKIKWSAKKDKSMARYYTQQFNRAIEGYGQSMEIILKKIGYLPSKENRAKMSF